MKAADYKQWYGTLRWRLRARKQITEHPLCAECLKQSRVTAARVADHIIPHKGNKELFWSGKLQSLCSDHHNSYKKRQEFHGYAPDIGVDGWPIDPNHPANAK